MNSVLHYAQFVYDKYLGRKSGPSVTNSSSICTTGGVSRRSSSDNCCVELALNFCSSEMGAINNLPDELLDLIMDNLDTGSLKQCRLVCWKWDQVVSSKVSFLKKLCIRQVYSFNGVQDIGLEITSYVQQNCRPPLGLNSLRLNNLYSFWNPLSPEFFSWINSMPSVSWLEIRSSQLKMSQLLEILGKFPKLTTLRITGDTLIHAPASNDQTESGVLLSQEYSTGRFHLAGVQHLVLHFEDLHNFLISMDRLNLHHFNKLETLDLKGHAGNTTNVFRIGGIIRKLLSQSGRTLKVFRLDNFESSVRGGLDTKLASSKYQLRSSLYAEFPRFLSNVNWKDLPSLDQLQEISLDRFPIANTNDPNFQSILPLFANAKNLRKLVFSQLYFSEDVHFEKFVSRIPSGVSISMTSVHLVAPNPNLENITEVLHCEQNILKYQSASVRLKFLNVDWRIIYLTWGSLGQSVIMQKYVHLIRVLELTSVLFPIGDTEIQFIIHGATLLEKLTFESCDLSGLTDSGLTGLSSLAVNKLWADDAYEPSELDFIGMPIQRLTGLRSIKLGNVGSNVTHISVLKSFLHMSQLRSLTIHQDPLIIRGSAMARLRNRPNILVAYETPNQI